MIERVCIIVDGNNFYHRLRELDFSDISNFDYNKFGQFLTGQQRQLTLSKYYIGTIREEVGNEKSKKLMINQQKLITKLKLGGWQLGLGHMLKTDRYHEKGVDVLMAVDLLIGAFENIYDTAILVSSDTDLIPALKKIRQMKKKVEYIGFSHKPSYGLIRHSNIRRLLTKADLVQFL